MNLEKYEKYKTLKIAQQNNYFVWNKMAIFRLLSFDVLIHFKNLFWGFSQENCRRRDKNVWIRLKFSFVRVCVGVVNMTDMQFSTAHHIYLLYGMLNYNVWEIIIDSRDF